MMRKFSAVAALILLSGCTYPTSNTEQGAGRGQLYFPKARPGERVAIDGADAGSTSDFVGKQTLAVPKGLHRIVVTSDGRVVLDKKVYVDADTKTAVGGD
jgi:predicted small secreted protein